MKKLLFLALALLSFADEAAIEEAKKAFKSGNEAKGRAIMDAACDKGDGKACFMIGMNAVKSEKETVAYYQKGCEAGFARACFELSSLYQNKAVEVYEKGCEAGDVKMCFKLAFKYKDGEDVCVDSEKAAEWFEAGCKLGDKVACEQAKKLTKTQP